MAEGFGPMKAGGAGGRSSPYERPLGEQAEGEPCQFFAKAGWCKFGDTCRFAHIGEARDQEVCQFFVKAGWCKFGDQCKHLHIGGPDTPVPGDGLLQQLLSQDGQQSGEACGFFAKAGWCKFGDTCKYAHIGPAGAAPPPRSMGGMPPSQQQGMGEACEFFTKSGWCKFGDGCKYMHALAGGKGGPPPRQMMGGGKGGVVNAFMGGGEACQFFAKAGFCKWGDGCKYVHAGPGGAPGCPPMSAIAPMGRQQQVLLTGSSNACKFFASGGCRNGAMCTFEHVGPPGQSGQQLCEFFSKSGWCKFGDSCKYMHSGGPPRSVGGGGGGNSTVASVLGSLAALQASLGELAGGEHTAGAAAGSDEVCQFFVKTGRCKWGDGCKYVHAGGPPEDGQ